VIYIVIFLIVLVVVLMLDNARLRDEQKNLQLFITGKNKPWKR
jgi:hypothetical protein